MQFLYQIPNWHYLKYLQLVNTGSVPKAIQSKLNSIDISQPSEFKSLTETIITKTKNSKYLYTTLLRKKMLMNKPCTKMGEPMSRYNI